MKQKFCYLLIHFSRLIFLSLFFLQSFLWNRHTFSKYTRGASRSTDFSVHSYDMTTSPDLYRLVHACFSTLFCVERLRGYSPGAPNINVPPPPPPPFSVHFLPRREEEGRSRFLRPFFNFNPVHQFCLLSRVHARIAFSAISPLTGTFLSVYSGRVRVYSRAETH